MRKHACMSPSRSRATGGSLRIIISPPSPPLPPLRTCTSNGGEYSAVEGVEKRLVGLSLALPAPVCETASGPGPRRRGPEESAPWGAAAGREGEPAMVADAAFELDAVERSESMEITIFITTVRPGSKAGRTGMRTRLPSSEEKEDLSVKSLPHSQGPPIVLDGVVYRSYPGRPNGGSPCQCRNLAPGALWPPAEPGGRRRCFARARVVGPPAKGRRRLWPPGCHVCGEPEAA